MPFRLGDDVDDFCPKCKRLTNHVIVSVMDERPAKVRCRTCYHEQDFRDGVPPPSKRDLKKAELFAQVLAAGGTEAAPPVPDPAADPAPEAEAKPDKGKKKK
jgi:hypothetical protein